MRHCRLPNVLGSHLCQLHPLSAFTCPRKRARSEMNWKRNTFTQPIRIPKKSARTSVFKSLSIPAINQQDASYQQHGRTQIILLICKVTLLPYCHQTAHVTKMHLFKFNHSACYAENRSNMQICISVICRTVYAKGNVN